MLIAHIIEFVPGVGIVTDGVVDTSQGTGLGPYTWTKPANTALMDLHDGCGGGGKGGNGGVNATGAAGGGGGASGAHLMNRTLPTVPGTTLTITLGNGGTTGSTAGGNTTVAWSDSPPKDLSGVSVLTLNGGGGGANGGDGTSISGAIGGSGIIGNGGTGGASTPSVGLAGALVGLQYSGQFSISGSGSGGVGAASASTGGPSPTSTSIHSWGTGYKGGGAASGTYSGGGAATGMPWGKTGNPGNGNASGSSTPGVSSGFGVGGSGAGGASSGTATGADGMPGYYRITYYEITPLPTDWISAAGISAAAVTKLQAGLMQAGSYIAPDNAATVATAVWAEGSRTLTGFGTLVADIWSAASRTLSAFGFSVGLTSDYDSAKTAAQASQIPDDFTPATFSEPGVFAVPALANAPAGGGGGEATDPWATAMPGEYAAGTAGALLNKLNIGAASDPVVVLPSPPDGAEDCTVYLDTYQPGIEMTFRLSGFPSAGNKVMATDPVTVVSNAEGRIEGMLRRTDQITPAGRTYHVMSKQLKIDIYNLEFTEAIIYLRTLIPEFQPVE